MLTIKRCEIFVILKSFGNLKIGSKMFQKEWGLRIRHWFAFCSCASLLHVQVPFSAALLPYMFCFTLFFMEDKAGSLVFIF